MIVFTEASDSHANEDAVLVAELPTGREGWIGAVADGQGGRPGGARAAQLACQAIIEIASRDSIVRLGGPANWSRAFQEVDRRVQQDADAGLTTLVAFCIENGYVHGASCGDSGACLFNAGVQIIDLTANQVKNPQIGSGMTSCTFFTSPLARPWSLLAMTDGVWKYAGRSRIADSLRTARGEVLSELIQSAGRLPGNGKFPDDFSFALIES